MTLLSRRAPFCASAAGLALLAGAAAADVTPRDVWASWQELGRRTGQSVTATERAGTDGALILDGLALRSGPPGAATVVRVPQITLVPDGAAVRILPGETAVLTHGAGDAAGDEGGAGQDAEIAVQMTAAEIRATGDRDAIDYALAADRLEASVADAPLEGADQPLTASLAATAVDGTWSTSSGTGPPRFAADLAADEITLQADIPETETGTGTEDAPAQGAARLAVAYSGASARARGTLASLAPDAPPADLDLTLRIDHQGARQRLEGETPEGPFALDTRSAGGSLDATVAEGAVAYDVAARGLHLAVDAGGLPTGTLEADIDIARFALGLPVAPSEAARPVSLHAELDGVAPADPVWTLFDPEGVLPREPARLVLDLTGRARQLAVGPGAESLAELTGLVPEDLSLNSLRLSALGAELTGGGALSFPDAARPDPGRAPGAPGAPAAPGGGPGAMPTAAAPEGRIDLRLVGADGLIDKLVAVGIIPEDQAMGARLMLGLFTAPAEDGDGVVTVLEFGPDGSISANGQRIR